ncbi:hypothetical protein [Paenibacillus dokdonensis]|uniref:hypothetical protein n=1 Tax=Paenibacillus dokdonensis TaxID=2567944 RepID=UPI0010A8D76C|nr:hypothetical protein [Paenibacillus dokdonensis]
MKTGLKLLMVCSILILLLGGCSSRPEADTLAVIQAQKDSDYEEMFNALSLGNIFDYNLSLPHADKTWVEVWVEGYKKGKKMQGSPLISLSYGFAPSKTSAGALGWGIVKEGGAQKSMILYAPGAGTGLSSVPDVIDHNLSSMMGSVIGDQKLELKAGESTILAVCRQNESGVYQTFDPEQLKEMLQTDAVTLLLKIKLDTKSPK